MNFTQFRAMLATELVITDPAGLILLDGVIEQIIDFAEDRIHQDSDLDFLGTNTIDGTARTTPAQRTVYIPIQFVVVEQINLIVPYSHQADSPGSSRLPLLRTSLPFLDMKWPNSGPTAVRTPKPYETYFAIPFQNVLVENETAFPENTPGSAIYIAPTVDAEYVCEIRGTFDPTPLSADNPVTFLSTYFPSLLFAAAMAYATGALKQNYGAQQDDPRQAISWEQQFQIQKTVAGKRVNRQTSWGPGWVPFGPSPMAAIPRFQMMPPPQAGGGGGG